MVLTASGCAGANMAQIDRRIEETARERGAAIGAERSPLLKDGSTSATRRARTEKQPDTINPRASELSYVGRDTSNMTPAEIAQSLSDTLEGYAGRAVGLDRLEVKTISLAQAFEIAQNDAREFRTAEEDYLLSAIRLLIQRHLFDPRLFNDTSVVFDSEGSDGRFDNAVRLVNNLRLTKQLPYGGQAEARWIWNAAQQLRSSVEGQYVQSSTLVLAAEIPLLRGAGLVAQESLIQAERDLVYAARDFERFRRTFYVSIAVDYFQLLQTLAEIRNQIAQLRSLRAFEEQRRQLYEAGRISEFDVNDAANRVLGAESSLASRRESYALSLDRFKVRLGIPVTEPLQINGVRFLLDAPSVSLDEATESALTFRLDLQNTADRVLDTARELDNAENNLLPDLGIGGQVGIPTDPDAREGGVVFDPNEADLSANINLSLPLDRENERLRLRESQIRLQRSQRAFDRIRDEVILEVRQRVRNIDLARFRLELAQRQVEINERRQEEQRIKADEVDTNRRLDTEADLLNSLNARDQAVTDLRISILNYLLSAGRLRVDLAGQLAPLDGMMLEFIDTPLSFPELFGPVGGSNVPALPPEPMTVDEQEEAQQQAETALPAPTAPTTIPPAPPEAVAPE